MRYFLLLAVLSASTALGAVEHVVHGQRSSIPSHWKRQESLDKGSHVEFKVALKETNLHLMEEVLMNVSDPRSPNYGKHWNAQQVIDFFAPTEESVQQVRDWLVKSGVPANSIALSKTKGVLHFNATIQHAEEIFKNSYDLYQHVSNPESISLAAMNYSLPSHVQPHVEFVSPTTQLGSSLTRAGRVPKPVKKPARHRRRHHHNHHDRRWNFDWNWESLVSPDSMKKKQQHQQSGPNPAPKSAETPKSVPGSQNARPLDASLENCAAASSPTCVRAMYGIPVNTHFNKKNNMAVVSYDKSLYSASDLSLFLRTYTNIPDDTKPIMRGMGDNPYTRQGFDGQDIMEPNLDFQYSIPFVYPQPVVLWQAGGFNTGTPEQDFSDVALADNHCREDEDQSSCGKGQPWVVSVSWGDDEAVYGSDNWRFQDRQCRNFAKLGMLGYTLVFASMDNGVAGLHKQCRPNDRFLNSFPSSCPYVLSVGESRLPEGGKIGDREIVNQEWTGGTSGGGFSDIFPMPSYQSSTLKKWWQNHKPSYSSSQYNTTMRSRGVPDISAFGTNLQVILHGGHSFLGGTSASTPIVSSMITLLNQARLDQGKGPLGFINPLFYAHANAFTDVISGNNPGCGTPGFQAVEGWDPVSGLGTPNYPKLLAIATALP